MITKIPQYQFFYERLKKYNRLLMYWKGNSYSNTKNKVLVYRAKTNYDKSL